VITNTMIEEGLEILLGHIDESVVQEY